MACGRSALLVVAAICAVGTAEAQGGSGSAGASSMGQASRASGYISTASAGSLSQVTSSQFTASSASWSTVTESRRADSADRTSRDAASDFRASEVRESQVNYSEARWSDVRDSASSVTYSAYHPTSSADTLAGAGALAGQPVLVPPDIKEWSADKMKTGTEVASLPPIYMTVTVNQQVYQVWDNIFYQSVTKDDGSTAYQIVPPPVGALLPGMPVGATPVTVGNHRYLVADNIYFQETTGGWLVVAPPPGAPPPEPPPPDGG
jgi:hypothetical protein